MIVLGLVRKPVTPDPPDTTAPVLTSPTAIAVDGGSGSGTVTTDEGFGTLYWVCTTSAVAPTGTQIKAGTDDSDVAAADSGSQTVTFPPGAEAVSMTGLTPEGTYYNHYYQEDAAKTPNGSNVATSASFTTPATVTPLETPFTADGTFVVPNYNTITVYVYGAGGGGGGGGINSNNQATSGQRS